MRRRTVPKSQDPDRGAVAGGAGSLATEPKANAGGCPGSPPPPGTPAPDFGDICPRSSRSQPEAPGRVPTRCPNSQPVSFLISSSSSSRSNVEARDPIAEPEAPPRAGAPEATAEAGGKEGREAGPGVKKEEGSVSTADWGKVPEGGARARASPRAANEERGCAGRRRRRRRSRLQPPNESPQHPAASCWKRTRPRNCDATGLKRAMPLWL